MDRLHKNGGAEKMMKPYFVIIVILCILSLVSCSTARYNIKRNKEFMTMQVDSLYKKNGNAFYLCSTYVTTSVVWTYYEDKIEIYRLQGRIIRGKQTFITNDTLQHVVSLENIEEELYRECALELDGDSFGFIVDFEQKIQIADYSVNINCMKQGRFGSDFLRKIINDINTHAMWDFDYQ